MSKEASFYHLTSTPLEKALPQLLDKILQSQNRAVILCPNDSVMENLNGILWNYRKAFLAHGSEKDSFRERQPIYLTTNLENPADAKILVLTFNYDLKTHDFERVLVIFDGTNEEELKKARMQWKDFKSQNYKLNYWKQNEKAGWEKVEL